MNSTLPPITLFINITNFCKKKIHLSKKYIFAIIEDFKKKKIYIKNRIFHAIYISGTEINFFKPKIIIKLLQKIRLQIKCIKNIEITMEINPYVISIKNIKKYIKYGINRLSLNVHTFNKYFLKKIYKKNVKQLNINLIQKISKINSNFEIIYGLPGQSWKNAIKDLMLTIQFKPTHISWYPYSYEYNFLIHKKNILQEKYFKKINHLGKILLKKAGYKQYEQYSYTKEKKYQCKHNLNYWNFGDYIGLGCCAHSKITTNQKKIFRIINTKNIFKNMNQEYEKKFFLKKTEIPLEFFLNISCLKKNISYKHFEKYTFIKKRYIKNEINLACKNNYLINKKKWIITKKGRTNLNNFLLIFLKL